MTEMDKFIADLGARKQWDTPYLVKIIKDRNLVLNWDKNLHSPTELRIGDIYASNFMNHPAVIIKVRGNEVTSVCLTSKNATHNIYQIQHSRFFRGSYVSLTILNTSIEHALSRYLGSLEGKEDIKQIMKALRERYKLELSLRPLKLIKEEAKIIPLHKPTDYGLGVTFMEEID